MLSHEMAHVIARHAAIREDQARQAALVSHVVNDIGSRSRSGRRMALAKIQAGDGELLARAGIRGRRHRRRHRRARRLRPLRRGAVPDLDGTQRRTRAPARGIDPRALDFLSSHPATPERVSERAGQCAAILGARRAANATATPISAPSTASSIGEDPNEGFVRGRRFLHPKLGFTFTAPDGFSLDNTAQAVIGIREGGQQAMRLDVVRVPAEQRLIEYLEFGLDRECRTQASVEELTINGFPAATATAKGDQWTFRALCAPLRQRSLPLHLRRQAPARRNRAHLPRGGRTPSAA